MFSICHSFDYKVSSVILNNKFLLFPMRGKTLLLLTIVNILFVYKYATDLDKYLRSNITKNNTRFGLRPGNLCIRCFFQSVYDFSTKNTFPIFEFSTFSVSILDLIGPY